MKKIYGCLKHLAHSTLLLCLLLSACVTKSQELVESTPYRILLKGLLSKDVPHTGVSALLNSNTENTLFVDARELKEYNVSHLPKAVFVGYDNLDLSPLNTVDKNKEIIVYCSVGYRSEKVTQKLIEQGFTNVKNLYGGLFEWKNQKGEVVNLQGNTTDSIHAFNKTWGMWLKKGNKVYD